MLLIFCTNFLYRNNWIDRKIYKGILHRELIFPDFIKRTSIFEVRFLYQVSPTSYFYLVQLNCTFESRIIFSIPLNLYTMKIGSNFLIILFLLSKLTGLTQIENVNGFWRSIGPNTLPDNSLSYSANGIGPIEFIRAHPTLKGNLLAGSLNGGLFFSDNYGDSWVNAGSDYWDYSACAWADFHPEKADVWFGCSNDSGDNGGPGKIDYKGGLLRTVDAGVSWENIGDYKDFGNNIWIKIFGTRFHPNDPEFLFIFTSEGLYYTDKCLSEDPIIKKVSGINGWVYDLVFMEDNIYLTNLLHGQWSLLRLNQDDFSRAFRLNDVILNSPELDRVTLAVSDTKLLLLLIYPNKTDKVIQYDPLEKKTIELIENISVNFGQGRTFSVNPHNPKEVYIGSGTTFGKWHPPYKKRSKIGKGYHVDIEFVLFDPFDTARVYIATHGGVYRSDDSGETWFNKSENLGVAEVMGLAVNPNDFNQVAIGTYHDGSMLRFDFDNNGEYYWRTINGGDGLIPLINKNEPGNIYSSNQYQGGGIYISLDTNNTKPENLHSKYGLKTPGWEMAAILHEGNNNIAYFNHVEKTGLNSGNSNICRFVHGESEENKIETISDFNASHKLKRYRVYGLFTSHFYPNTLVAYVLEYKENSKKEIEIIHRLYRNDQIGANALLAKKSWYEIQVPKNNWISDVEIDQKDSTKLYIGYTTGTNNSNEMSNKSELVYVMRYKKPNTYMARRKKDISKGIPIETAGRYNMVYTDCFGGGIFIATKTGVYYGNRKSLKGRRAWQKIGEGLPHCKVYGLAFDDKRKVLTVGLFGRGVWQYFFE